MKPQDAASFLAGPQQHRRQEDPDGWRRDRNKRKAARRLIRSWGGKSGAGR